MKKIKKELPKKIVTLGATATFDLETEIEVACEDDEKAKRKALKYIKSLGDDAVPAEFYLKVGNDVQWKVKFVKKGWYKTAGVSGKLADEDPDGKNITIDDVTESLNEEVGDSED